MYYLYSLLIGQLIAIITLCTRIASIKKDHCYSYCWHDFLSIGFRNLSMAVEEGICQVLSHLWLESEIIAGSSSNVASSSAASSSSSSSSAPTSSKKGAKTEFEKKLGAFIKNQIETDSSEAYGDGFRAGYPAVERYGLRRTLDHIKLTGSFPYWSSGSKGGAHSSTCEDAAHWRILVWNFELYIYIPKEGNMLGTWLQIIHVSLRIRKFCSCFSSQQTHKMKQWGTVSLLSSAVPFYRITF